MDNKSKSKKENCPDFHKKIFGLFESGTTIVSDSSLKNHIDICQNCQNYLENLSIIKNEMKASPSIDLMPNPQILKNIIAYKNVKSGLKRNKKESLWGTIRAIFEFKIPVYQALSGAVLVLMLFMYVSGYIVSPDPDAKYIEYTGNLKAVNASELYALDSLNYSNPGRGQNAREDSVLISFLVPTM